MDSYFSNDDHFICLEDSGYWFIDKHVDTSVYIERRSRNDFGLQHSLELYKELVFNGKLDKVKQLLAQGASLGQKFYTSSTGSYGFSALEAIMISVPKHDKRAERAMVTAMAEWLHPQMSGYEKKVKGKRTTYNRIADVNKSKRDAAIKSDIAKMNRDQFLRENKSIRLMENIMEVVAESVGELKEQLVLGERFKGATGYEWMQNALMYSKNETIKDYLASAVDVANTLENEFTSQYGEDWKKNNDLRKLFVKQSNYIRQEILFKDGEYVISSERDKMYEAEARKQKYKENPEVIQTMTQMQAAVYVYNGFLDLSMLPEKFRDSTPIVWDAVRRDPSQFAYASDRIKSGNITSLIENLDRRISNYNKYEQLLESEKKQIAYLTECRNQMVAINEDFKART